MNTDKGRLNFATGIDNSQMQSDAAQSRNILHSIGKTAVREGQNIDNAMKNIGKTIAAAFTAQQLTAFASSVVQVRSQIQSLEVSFTTLLGSQTKAKQLFGEIQQYAVKTPMQLDDLAKGAQTLLSFNVAADKVMPTLRALGDISMGDAQKFQSLTLAFAQIQSTGKLMGQDLLQLINAGFNPLSVISEKTGKSIGVLKEEMSKGAISAQMVEDAFMSATSEGGKFFGMLDAQSKTLTGSLSNLEGAWNDMLNDIGTRTEGVMTDAISLATTCVQHYEAFVNVLMGLATAYGTYKAALMAVVVVEQARNIADNIRLMMMFRKELGLLTAAQQAFNITAMKNPYVLIAAAIAGVITALVAFSRQEDEAQKRIDKANDKLKEQQTELERLKEKRDAVNEAEKSAAQDTADEINKIEILSSVIHDNTASLDDRRRAISQMQSLIPKYHATLDDEGRLHRDNTNAIEEHIKSLNRLAMARALQSKREEFVSQKVNAEIDRRTAKQNEKKANEDIKIAKEKLHQEQEEYERRKEELDNTTIGSGNLFVQAAFASEEGQISRGETSKAYLASVNAAKKEFQVAELELQLIQGEIKNADIRIQNADEQLAVLDDMLKNYQDVDTSKPTHSIDSTTDSKKKKSPLDSTLSQLEYEASVKAQVRQSELDLEQERINGMNEGVQKFIDQSKLNYDRMTFVNKQREADMIAELRKQRQQEWENVNPNATEQEKMSHELMLHTSITRDDLTTKQRDIINEYTRIAEEYRQKANKESLDIMLSDILTYEQQREKITEEYARRRSSMYIKDNEGNTILRNGVTQGNVDELNEQEQKALTAIDEQFAQREVTYQAWCEQVASMSLEQLQAVLAQAEEELQKLKESGSADNQQMAVAQAKVATAKTKLEKAKAKNDISPDERSVKEWEDLYKVLNECNQSFEQIGNTVGGIAGEIISSAGGITTSTLSMINGIMQLVQKSAIGMQSTATAAAVAISTVEKASVILTVISAALQIATQIANMFNKDDERQKEIDALQERITQLQWELDNADALHLQQNSLKAMNILRTATAETREEMVRLKIAMNDTSSVSALMTATIADNNALLNQSAQKVAKAYANIAYTADKAFGNARFDTAKDQLQNIAKQQLLIQEQIDAENRKKDKDDKAIQNLKNKIQELGQQAIEFINEKVEEIIGGTSNEIADELANAFFDAFEAGEDAAKAWGDKVNDIVADVIRRMLVNKFLEEPLGEVFNQYKDKWFKDGKFAGIDAVINSMTGFAADLNSIGTDFVSIFDSLPDSIKDIFTADNINREASRKGISTASQESVNELNGRATAIQGHTYSISENTKLLVAHSAAILESVLNIEAHTENISNRIENVETSINNVKDTVNDIITKGINIR